METTPPETCSGAATETIPLLLEEPSPGAKLNTPEVIVRFAPTLTIPFEEVVASTRPARERTPEVTLRPEPTCVMPFEEVVATASAV